MKYSKLRKQKRKMYRDTWDLCSYSWDWLVPRIKMYKNACKDKIILYGDEANHFEFEGKTYSQGELIDMMIECADKAAGWYDLTSSVEQQDAAYKFWKIWAIVFPAMWW